MNSVVTALVAHEHLRMCIVEMPSVIVSIYCECPSTSLPCYGAIEVVQSHILVILPRSQHEAEVCVTAIPPDAEDISVSVQAHQVVEIDLIDSLILCSGEVEFARIIIFFISLSPIFKELNTLFLNHSAKIVTFHGISKGFHLI